MTVLNKVKWVLGILVVFFLIVATNLVDKSNFESVKDSVVEIYEDRLVAKGIVFEISQLVQEKEMAHALADEEYFTKKNEATDEHIRILLGNFSDTKLTENEKRIFSDLKSNLSHLSTYEAPGFQSTLESQELVQSRFRLIKEELNALSKIQIEEGKQLMLASQRAIEMVDLFTQIEIYFLIFMAVLIQIIILYRPKRSEEAEA